MRHDPYEEVSEELFVSASSEPIIFEGKSELKICLKSFRMKKYDGKLIISLPMVGELKIPSLNRRSYN